MCLCVRVCAHGCSTGRGQKRAADPLKLKLAARCMLAGVSAGN